MNLNGFLSECEAAHVERFRIRPVSLVRKDTDAEATALGTADRFDFWSLEGFKDGYWRSIHQSDDASSIVAVLDRLSRGRVFSVYYEDASQSCGPTCLGGLVDWFTGVIIDEIPDVDDPERFRDDDFENHPFSWLREEVLAVVEGG